MLTEVHLLVKTVYTCPIVKISSSLKMHVCAHVCTHTHSHQLNIWVCALESELKEGALPWVLGERGSGMFSKFCFGVRLSGDRASINFAEHLGSLKPERALQFINLNLLTLQLEKTSRKL